jgi:GLPGLI family protein
MKPNFYFILILMVLLGASACGQKTIHIVYSTSVSYKNPQIGDTDKMEEMKSMFESVKMEVFANDKFCRVNTSDYQGTQSVIIDRKTKNAIILDARARAAAHTTIDELKKESTQENEYTVTLTDSVKKIAGYTCKKAIVTTKEGRDSIPIDIWYTTDLNLGDLGGTPLGFGNTPGAPIEVCFRYGFINMTYTASKIDLNATVNSNTFDMAIPKGYESFPLNVLENIGSGN